MEWGLVLAGETRWREWLEGLSPHRKKRGVAGLDFQPALLPVIRKLTYRIDLPDESRSLQALATRSAMPFSPAFR